ncbi:hypothetical protein BDR07DRAFT_1495575 [Suillus spraguei]|nr:hypothetical protein BDR07DRAFT_1496174 [Suillus spraguei]KAG2353837.1 hypothetical protein BDR07DRAFT_1495575 [Suillus spraguei]
MLIPTDEANCVKVNTYCELLQFISLLGWATQWRGKEAGYQSEDETELRVSIYALVLQSMSVLAYRSPLLHTCLHPDAQRRTNNQTPVSPAVVATVLHDVQSWKLLNQLIKTVKFLVDAIGNLESRDTTLADCMLELIRCARQMSQLQLDAEDDDTCFWMHARSVFNCRFHAINTNFHSLALFLHPMCRKLAVTDASKGRPFEFMVKTALAIAKQWRWGEHKAKLLIDDLQAYNLCRTPFAGGHADGLAWWEHLAVSADRHPLKALAITLLSIGPHAADVERLFSDMGSTQSPKHCNLSVDTFEALAKIRANLRYHTHQKAPGINVEIAADLEANFTWAPPFAPQTQNVDDDLAGPESISLNEIDAAFALLEHEKESMERVLIDGLDEVLEGQVYNFAELECADQGLLPKSVDDEIIVVDHSAKDDERWDVDTLMLF